jgi:REP element-mobilizing transposase RayT
LRGAIADNVGMSLPRAIVPGRRYMITRRCSERRFFMRPDRETNNAFIYCLALAARKAGISIVCVGTLSNHYHAVLVDNHGRLPQFLEHFHKLYGKHQNALQKDLTKVDPFFVGSATDAHDVAGRRPDLPLRSAPNIRPWQATCAAPLPTMSACPFRAPLSQAAAT